MGVRLAAGVMANPVCAGKINGPDTTAVLADCISIVADVAVAKDLYKPEDEPAPNPDPRFQTPSDFVDGASQ